MVSIVSQKHINFMMSEQDFSTFSTRLTKSELKAALFIQDYAKSYEINEDDVLTLLLVSALTNPEQDAEMVNWILSQEHNSSILTTTVGEFYLSPISLALRSSTSDEVLYSLKALIASHQYEKVQLEENTLLNFQTSIYGGEYSTKEETIQTFLNPLFEDVATKLLGY